MFLEGGVVVFLEGGALSAVLHCIIGNVLEC